MGKVIRLVVAGGPETGKTAMLERLIHNNYHPDKKFYSTKEDIYLANIQIRGRAETLRIHDTSGAEWIRTACPPRHLCHYGDGFILTYDITNEESFNQIRKIKTEIEKELNKKDIPMTIVAMKTDLENQRAVDKRVVQSWADREKIEHYEVSVMDRGFLAEPISYLANKLAAPPSSGRGLFRNKDEMS